MVNYGLLIWCFYQDKKDKDDKEKVLEEDVEFVFVFCIIKMNLFEWLYLSIGSIVGVINGFFLFVFVLVLLEIFVVSDIIYFILIRNVISFYYEIELYVLNFDYVYMQLFCISRLCLMLVVKIMLIFIELN